MTVMGDAFMEELSDRGSIPPQVHTCKTAENEMIQRFLNTMSQNEERAFCSLLIYHILCI